MMKFRYLTGNPCGDHEGYRDYVVATLPQLQVRLFTKKKFWIIEISFVEIRWK